LQGSCTRHANLDFTFKSSLNSGESVGTADIAGNLDWLQGINTPEILKVALRVCHFPTASNTFNLIPYVRFSTSGQKEIGLRTTFACESDP